MQILDSSSTDNKPRCAVGDLKTVSIKRMELDSIP